MSDVLQVETTVQDVIGTRPFSGTERFALVRPTLKTWLMRQGWNAKIVAKLSDNEFRSLYTNFDDAITIAAMHGMPIISKDRGMRFAAAPYIPKANSVLNFIRRRRAGAAPIDAVVDDDEGQASAPVNEEKLVELIKKHVASVKPAETIIKVVSADKVQEIKGAKHPKLALLAKAMAARMLNGFHVNVWLYGPTASGKTHSVEQVATAMKRKFYMHGAMAMSHELMGYKDANGKYHTTPFRECYEKGGVCLMDECDSWDPAVTLALNGALANGVVAFPDGMVRRHVDSIFVAAGNTVGAGATAEFVGRNKLDAAFMSRFPVKIEWPRDASIEHAIAGNASWTNRVIRARERAAIAGLKHAIDPRHSQAGAALIAAGMTEEQAAELTYLAGLSDAQRRTVEGPI